MSFYNSVEQLRYMLQRTQRTKYSMSPLGLSLLVILAFATITISNPTQLSFAQNNTLFVNSFEKLVKNVNNLSESYHNETGKFAKGQINNKTMITITDNYQPKYQNLINQAKELQPPKELQNATDLYTKSLELELQSNNHFRNYLSNNNSSENTLSSNLLSDSFNYELEAFKKLKAAGSFTIVP